jgi:hypothetical protein
MLQLTEKTRITGNSFLKSGANKAGLSIPSNATLIIAGTGSLMANGGTLCITAATAGEARIYSISGGLAKSIPVAAGTTANTPLPAGFHVVVFGGKPYKVFVQ